MTAAQAAAAFVPYGLATMGGTFVVGALAARLPPTAVLAIPSVLVMAAMQVVQVATPGLLVAVYAVFLGAANGSIRSLEPALMPEFYGLAHIEGLRGRMKSVKIASSAVGPYALALGFENFGGYGSTLMALTALPGLGDPPLAHLGAALLK